jgi:hypothetical protein
MCEPVTIAMAAMALGSTAVGAYSQIKAGQAASKLADRQALLANQAAGDARTRGRNRSF